VHGTRVVPAGTEGEADGQVVTAPGRAAVVFVADCLPVIVRGDGGAAALHCGWRGLAGGVVGAGVRALREAGVEGELEAVIGPGAGPCCYEVGDELRERLGGRGRFTDGRNLDLKLIAAEQLRAAGVARVEDVGVCTIHDERYFSFRREGDAAGRQIGAVWLD
jgi:copper oxidase (laccase) domain-containing protein